VLVCDDETAWVRRTSLAAPVYPGLELVPLGPRLEGSLAVWGVLVPVGGHFFGVAVPSRAAAAASGDGWKVLLECVEEGGALWRVAVLVVQHLRPRVVRLGATRTGDGKGRAAFALVAPGLQVSLVHGLGVG